MMKKLVIKPVKIFTNYIFWKNLIINLNLGVYRNNDKSVLMDYSN